MSKPLKLEIRENFRIYLVYVDGVEGEFDVSMLFKKSPYQKLNDKELFNRAKLIQKNNRIFWGKGISLCTDMLYNYIKTNQLLKRLKLNI